MAGFSVRLANSWKEGARRLKNAEVEVLARQGKAIRRAALMLEAGIKKGLRSGAPGGVQFKPLSLMTRLTRKGTKPLLDSGALLGSISTTVDEKNLQAFVGIHRTAGQGLVNVAMIHEFGTKPYAIKVTDAMRGFFRRLSATSGGKIKPLSPSKAIIAHPGIPARPFVRPVVEAMRSKLEGEIRLVLMKDGKPF